VAAFIFDASAVVKRYLKEIGSGWIHGLADPAASHELFLTRIARVEVVAAVTRRGRGNLIPAAAAAALVAQFRHDAAHQYTILIPADSAIAYVEVRRDRRISRSWWEMSWREMGAGFRFGEGRGSVE
jgi:predicted nucleic acid-binding protein